MYDVRSTTPLCTARVSNPLLSLSLSLFLSSGFAWLRWWLSLAPCHLFHQPLPPLQQRATLHHSLSLNAAHLFPHVGRCKALGVMGSEWGTLSGIASAALSAAALLQTVHRCGECEQCWSWLVDRTPRTNRSLCADRGCLVRIAGRRTDGSLNVTWHAMNEAICAIRAATRTPLEKGGLLHTR